MPLSPSSSTLPQHHQGRGDTPVPPILPHTEPPGAPIPPRSADPPVRGSPVPSIFSAGAASAPPDPGACRGRGGTGVTGAGPRSRCQGVPPCRRVTQRQLRWVGVPQGPYRRGGGPGMRLGLVGRGPGATSSSMAGCKQRREGRDQAGLSRASMAAGARPCLLPGWGLPGCPPSRCPLRQVAAVLPGSPSGARLRPPQWAACGRPEVPPRWLPGRSHPRPGAFLAPCPPPGLPHGWERAGCAGGLPHATAPCPAWQCLTGLLVGGWLSKKKKGN